MVTGVGLGSPGEEVPLLAENQSTSIPVGARHRLENSGLIEVQSGGYLGEDNIMRFEDMYRRFWADGCAAGGR